MRRREADFSLHVHFATHVASVQKKKYLLAKFIEQLNFREVITIICITQGVKQLGVLAGSR